jgi:jumonji domain-containing protein 7
MTYTPHPRSDDSANEKGGSERDGISHDDIWTLEPVEPEMWTRWGTVDPTTLSFKEEYEPIVVTLQRGDMLFLPSLWGHHVMQSAPFGLDSSASGRELGASQQGDAHWFNGAIAVNYWYNMDFGSRFAQHMFMRRIASLAGFMEPEEDEEDEELDDNMMVGEDDIEIDLEAEGEL